jgi:hypothetical protein
MQREGTVDQAKISKIFADDMLHRLNCLEITKDSVFDIKKLTLLTAAVPLPSG